MHQILPGDCRELMAAEPENSIDAIVTDPPYGLSEDPDIAEVLAHWLRGEFYEHGSSGFMGRSWDSFVPGPDYWKAAYRVLKPGGFLLAFSSTRTWDLLSIAIRMAGFENRDTIRVDGPPALAWTHGQGFPKGVNISKALDKMKGSNEDAYRVTAWIRAARDAAGLSNADLDRICGTNGMGGHWTSNGSQPLIPTLEHWQLLAPHLGPAPDWMAETLLLPRGQPGPAWFQREKVGDGPQKGTGVDGCYDGGWKAEYQETAPASEKAKEYEGWNTALKPSWEVILVFRKPCEGTVARNVLKWGVGGVNIGAARVATGEALGRANGDAATWGTYGAGMNAAARAEAAGEPPPGRWPANWFLIHAPGCKQLGVKQVCEDGCPIGRLDQQSGVLHGPGNVNFNVTKRSKLTAAPMNNSAHSFSPTVYDKGGGASRFFHQLPPDAPPFIYQAKAATSERSAGIKGLLWARDAARPSGHRPVTPEEWEALPEARRAQGNIHSTVKPLALARALARLYCPPGGRILDMFAGSGSLSLGAAQEGMRAIAMELDPDYQLIIRARLAEGDKIADMDQALLFDPTPPPLNRRALAARQAACTKCPGRCGAPVPGAGPDRPALAVVGLAPGPAELLIRRPYVGTAGALLWEALGGAGFTPGEVAILNAVACASLSPPTETEALNCYEHLEATLRGLAPRAILAVGDEVRRVLGGGTSWCGIPVISAPAARRGADPAALARAAAMARKVTHGR